MHPEWIMGMRMGLFLAALVWLAVAACHRPLRLPRQAVTSELELKRILSVNEVDLAPAGLSHPEILDSQVVAQMAVDNHPQVLAIRSRIAQAEAQVRSAGVWPNPEIEGRFLLGPDGKPQVEAALLFTVPLGGRVGKAQREALVKLDLVRLDLAVAKKRARLDALGMLARLAHHRAQLALLEDLAGKSRSYAALASSRQAASMADPLDVALVLADAASDRRQLAQARTSVDTVGKKLRLILGLQPEEGEFNPSSLDGRRIAESVADLLGGLSEHNPDVARAWLEVLVADSQAARLASERWPDLRVGPAIMAEEGRKAAGVLLGLPIPVFHSGREPYDEALAVREAALSNYRACVRRVSSQVHTLMTRLNSLQAELSELVGEASRAVEIALTLADVRYETGNLDVLRLLSVHRAFSTLKLDHMDLLLKHRLTILDLEALIGRTIKTEEVKP